jgi:hypothetical protein
MPFREIGGPMFMFHDLAPSHGIISAEGKLALLGCDGGTGSTNGFKVDIKGIFEPDRVDGEEAPSGW